MLCKYTFPVSLAVFITPVGSQQQAVVRVGHPLIICESLFRSHRGMEHSKPEKPYWLLIHSIAIANSFFLNAYEKRHNACYRSTADLKLHTHQDSSKAQIFCKRDKPKTVHTTSNNRCSAKSRCHLLHKHVIPRYKLSMWKLSQYFFLTLESYFQLLS